VSSTPKFIDRFEIVDRIGHGGMGAVYLARDPKLHRQVAIKLILEGFDNEESRERFEREARSIANLATHRNIVTIFDSGDYNGKPYIVMEYVPGETLAAKTRQADAIPLVQKLDYLEQLCAGLAHAHQAQIVHRDIKPVNVMVTPQGVVKILDFGIAHLGTAHTNLTSSGTVMGTFNYMSPEQIKGEAIDERSDIFAVGAVAYELFSRRQAFPGVLPAVFHQVVSSSPVSLTEIAPDLPPEVVAIVDKALEKRAADRYQDLETMSVAVARERERVATHFRNEPTIRIPRPTDREALTLDSKAIAAALKTPAASVPPEPRRVPVFRRTLEVAGAAAVTLALIMGARWIATRSSTVVAPTTAVARAPAPSPVATGTVLVDAVPWAEVTLIADGQGTRRPIAQPFTPMALQLSAGPYDITLKDPQSPATRTVRVDVPANGSVRAFVEFKKTDVDDYFRRAGWPGSR